MYVYGFGSMYQLAHCHLFMGFSYLTFPQFILVPYIIAVMSNAQECEVQKVCRKPFNSRYTVPCLGCTDDDDTCYVIINNVTMNDYAFENGSLILPGSVQGVYGTVCCGRSVIEAEQTCYRICPPQNGKLY